MKKLFLWVIFGLCFMVAPSARAMNLDQDAARIPVQNHGRIKPLSAFAQETVQFISGRKSWQGQSAVNLLLTHAA
ncbi:MAG: hypothetical protein WCI27_10320, partial [Candidatus Omnitrophota bacterium]